MAAATDAPAAEPTPPVVDGIFNEWDREHIAAVDPAGDADAAFDITRLWVRSSGTLAFVRFDTGRTLNLQSGEETEGTLRFRFACDRTDSEVVVDTRGRSVLLSRPEASHQNGTWHDTGYWSAPTYAAPEFEFRIDLSSIGAESGDLIRFTIEGSDTLDRPVEFRLGPPTASTQTGSFTLPEPTERQLRAVSLNTLRNGIVNPKRAPALFRLLKSANPDIILLQEEYNTSAEEVEAAIEGVLGGDWNIVKTRDTVIASPLPLTKLTSFNDAYSAAVIHPEGQAPRLILCVHPKCCGYISSDEDRRRIEETRAMIRTIQLARQRYGDELPVLLAGDWNLVGSRTPLDLLTNPTDADLKHIEARNPVNGETYTWYEAGSDFGPGMLDLVTVSANAAASSCAAVLDSTTLNPESLGSLGLKPDDSRASDHLMLVINFGT
ncbi:MAG: endonuclease/exonuclease/phosphatase family protein [Phycisphaerales bacterium JB050]